MQKEISKKNLESFNEQLWYAENFLESFLEFPDNKELSILEIGTAEAGVLRYFALKNHKCSGIEYSESRYQNSVILNKEINLNLVCGDITDKSTFADFSKQKFDMIIMRDVIEHIEDKKLALANIYEMLNEGGLFYISFPPKYSPFAGHQQMFPKKYGKLPYIHLFPNFLYTILMKKMNLSEVGINNFLDIKKTRLRIKEFYRIIEELGFKLKKNEYYLIRPNFEIRYNLKRKKNIFKISFLREIFTLGAKFVLTK